jgi:hypothetical protein
MQPFEPSDGCLALQKLMANGRWMADKIKLLEMACHAPSPWTLSYTLHLLRIPDP